MLIMLGWLDASCSIDDQWLYLSTKRSERSLAVRQGLSCIELDIARVYNVFHDEGTDFVIANIYVFDISFFTYEPCDHSFLEL